MSHPESEFIDWNRFTRRWSGPIQLHKPTPGTVMDQPETRTVALCMTGPIPRDRIKVKVPWWAIVVPLAIILLALAVFGGI